MFKQKATNLFKKYFSEFALIFISVILAFALTEWSNNQGKKISEEKIFLEILNGLKKDSIDLTGNIDAHKNGIKACKYWRKVITDNKADKGANAHFACRQQTAARPEFTQCRAHQRPQNQAGQGEKQADNAAHKRAPQSLLAGTGEFGTQ